MPHQTVPVPTRLAAALRVPTRLAAATAMLAAALALTGCGPSATTSTGAGAARSGAPAGSVGTATGTSGTGASGAASPASSASGASGTGASGAAGSGTGTSASGAPGQACRNLVATPAVRQAVTLAHQAYSHLTHIRPEPGAFYYGSCAGVRYAAVVFQAGPGAGPAEAVGLQDDGSAMQYYRAQTGGPWQHLTADTLPRDPRGCAAIADIPAALTAAWASCPLPGSGPADPAAPSLMSLGNPVRRPASAVLSGDSTLGLQAMSWAGWGTTTATGTGTGWVDECNPTCAAGTIQRQPIRITLTSPATACGVPYFGRAELRWTAAVPAGHPAQRAVVLQRPIC